MTDKKIKEDLNTEETAKFKGKYVTATGRRKTSVARVRIYKKGNGEIMINDGNATEFFASDYVTIIKQPLKLAGIGKDVSISIVVNGGGKRGQADAIRHGISRALISMDENLKPALKAKGWTTRDARKKERKKPGLKKARRAPQWSKR